MADLFKSTGKVLTATSATIYTCPSGATSCLVQAILLANNDTAERLGTVYWTDSSQAGLQLTIIKNGRIPPGSSLQILERPMVLEANDTIVALADVTTQVDITLAFREIIP
jgi:hypothetical protein